MELQPIKKQLHLNPYDYHKYLINEYVLQRPGDTKKLQERDTSKWKTDRDVIYENQKFIWNEDDQPASWEERLAKKYYDKLFREYCICDLSRYNENKIANRFRIEKEIVTGKGQFVCGEKSCKEEAGLRTWEVNFAYVEAGERKNALVKISKSSKIILYNSK
jgi:protein FRA10AC1